MNDSSSRPLKLEKSVKIEEQEKEASFGVNIGKLRRNRKTQNGYFSSGKQGFSDFPVQNLNKFELLTFDSNQQLNTNLFSEPILPACFASFNQFNYPDISQLSSRIFSQVKKLFK